MSYWSIVVKQGLKAVNQNVYKHDPFNNNSVALTESSYLFTLSTNYNNEQLIYISM